jgi:hypothetical protein
MFDGDVSKDEPARGFILTIRREGDDLFPQATGQPEVQGLDECDRDFLLKVDDRQIPFMTDAPGAARPNESFTRAETTTRSLSASLSRKAGRNHADHGVSDGSGELDTSRSMNVVEFCGRPGA